MINFITHSLTERWKSLELFELVDMVMLYVKTNSWRLVVATVELTDVFLVT